jgi:uncharacterized protein
MENKHTLVIGASPNPERYSFKAVALLQKFGHHVEAVGIRQGKIEDVEIQLGLPGFAGIHTVTLYVGIDKQESYRDYLMKLHPKRIIFNPGTENKEFENLAKDAGIEVVEDCTLLMLNGARF